MLVTDDGLYVNLLVEFVAIPVPILPSKDNNYYTIIPSINVQLGDAVDCSL